MVACCAPTRPHTEETLNTLHFAQVALHIKSEPVVVLDPHDQLVVDLKSTIVQLKAENRKLAKALKEMADVSGGGLENMIDSLLGFVDVVVSLRLVEKASFLDTVPMHMREIMSQLQHCPSKSEAELPSTPLQPCFYCRVRT